MSEAWTEAQKRINSQKSILEASQRFGNYSSDPITFCQNILSEHFTDPVKDVIRSVQHNPITIARSGNGTGKSFSAARIAVWFYLVHPDAQVYLTAAPPIENLRRILWGHVLEIVRKHPELFKGHTVKRDVISRSSLSFISCVAIPTAGSSEERQAKFSGKHAPHMLFVVDEGDAVPEEVYLGIESCMSGGDAHMLVMFNPRAASGPVYTKEAQGLANVVKLSALDHPNVITGQDVIPGAVSREITARRINQWTRPLLPGEHYDADCFELPDYLDGYVAIASDGKPYPPLSIGPRKVMEPCFSYIVLGEYPAMSEMQLINRAWIDAARKRWDEYVREYGERPPDGVQPILGLDVAEFGVDSNILCPRYNSFVPRMIFWQGVDADITATKALEYYLALNAKIINVDAMGVGSSVAPTIARRGRGRDVRAIAVKVSEKPSPLIKAEQGEFYQMRDQLWWAVREWLRTDPTAMLPPDPYLLEELKTVTYKDMDTNGKIKVMGKEQLRELLKRSTDRADALCLTFTPITRAKVISLGGGSGGGNG